MRPVQHFSDDYLAQCKNATPDQIIAYLEQFRLLRAGSPPSRRSKLISIKIPEALLVAFRAKCDLLGLRYQSQIKVLMSRWLDVTGQ